MMKHLLWLVAALLLAAFDVWCFTEHWSAVAGNTAASVIWTTPALVAHHVLTRRRQDRHNAEQTGRAEAQAAQMASVAAQLGELHRLHIHGTWPEDRHRDR